MIVVSDTSPLNYLILIGHIDVLPKLFDRILAPPIVLGELQHANSPEAVQNWARTPPDWLEVRSPIRIDSSIKLDDGEIEAISLAVELAADQILVDDGRARSAALARGIRVTGTLAVLHEAAVLGLVDLPVAIAALQETNFRATPAIWKSLESDERK